MITPYLPRLAALCLATFFLLHTVSGLVISLAGPALVEFARRFRPRAAARLLLALRLLPAALGLAIVFGVCVPSYLWLEPAGNTEEVGAACLLAAALGAAIWIVSTAGAASATLRSLRFARTCELRGRLTTLPASRRPVRLLPGDRPLLALVGLFRSRVVISHPVRAALSPAQLAAALRHEDAHRISRDNLKRLLLRIVPSLLPGFHGFETTERGWERFSEWAADDEASAGNPRRALALAAALVRIARLGPAPSPAPLATPLLGDAREFPARVARLLHPVPAPPLRSCNSFLPVAAWTLAATAGAAMLHPVTLASAHRLFEQWIH